MLHNVLGSSKDNTVWKHADIHGSELKRNLDELDPECEEILDQFILLIISLYVCTRMTYNKNLNLKEYSNRY